MAKYTFNVRYSEVVVREQEVTVEAESLEEAEELAYSEDALSEDAYEAGKYLVDVNTEIEEIEIVSSPEDEDED